MKIHSAKVDLNILSADVGEISESDIQLAAASKATIIGFHTKIESRAEDLIRATKVTVKLHDIIYHVVDDVKAVMLTLLDKIPQENDTGTALVKAVFKSSQLGAIAGCQVTDGNIKRTIWSASCATTKSSGKVPSTRSSGSKRMSAKSLKVLSAEFCWKTSATSRKGTSSKPMRSPTSSRSYEATYPTAQFLVKRSHL